MKNIILSKRLQYISDLVAYRRVCDVACDHGKIIAKLFCDNKIDYAIVSDISEKCSLKAKSILDNMNVVDYDMRVGDGFENIFETDNIQEAIISGLGGLEIIKIMQNATKNIKSFIIQPQNNNILVKKFLINNGYRIVHDKIIKDDKFYNIFKVVRGECSLSEFDIYFGKENFTSYNKEFYEYLNVLDNKINKFINKLSDEKLLEYTKIKEFIRLAKLKLGD